MKFTLNKPNGIVIWSVFNGIDFDAIVIRNFWIYRQECYIASPGEVAWRDVPFFRKRIK